MAINDRLQRLFDETRSSYAVLPHPEAFTAQQVAQQVHVTGRHLAKVVVIRDEDGKDSMVVIPATHRLDTELLRRATGRTGFRLEDERDLKRLFPDCEVGAMPPFGAVYGHRVFVDQLLVGEPELVFNAGTHTEALCMHYGDVAELAKPTVGTFAKPCIARRES